MSGPNLPNRPQLPSGPHHATATPNLADSRGFGRALVLIQDPEQTLRLQGVLSSLGVEVLEARSASGAAAVLRREEARGYSFDLLLVDGRFGGICGISLSAALCMPLGNRPEVVLQSSRETPLDAKALKRSGIHAVIRPESTCEELRTLLHGCRRAKEPSRQVRQTPAGRVTS